MKIAIVKSVREFTATLHLHLMDPDFAVHTVFCLKRALDSSIMEQLHLR